MAKRQKLEEQQKAPKPAGSKIFSPFRTLGVVTNNVPFTVTSLGQAYIIVTVVGNAFQVYDAANLHLLFVSQPQTPQPIDCIHANFQHIFAGYGSSVAVYKRARLVSSIELPEADKPKKITTFGDYVCVATSSKVHIYKFKPKDGLLEFYTTLEPPKLLGSIVDISHLPTYLNKLVVATESALTLFNVKTGRLIYTFADVPSGISFIEPAPTALDVVAVVANSGDVCLFNLRKARELFTLKVGEPVTSLTFRSDQPAMLGLGSTNGDLFFYDLVHRRRIHSVRSHHVGPVTKVQFLANQPIAVSTGSDNRLVELVFDPALATSSNSVSAPPRVLRARGGHSRPPTTLEFADEEAHFVLSGGLDQELWTFSLRKDAQSHMFSQRASGKQKKMSKIDFSGPNSKFPPMVDLAFQPAKLKEWDSVLTAHKNEPFARTWDAKRGIVGAYQFETLDGSAAKAVGISPCGNFGIVGSAKGSVAVYNMQSGIRRKVFRAHTQSVTGVFVNSVNTTLYTASLDGKVGFHDFQSEKLLHELDLGAGITSLRYHPGAGLLAAAVDTMAIVVIDTLTHKIVRQFWGHGNRLTSLDFTPDGRWIISAALDGTIRTWDIPSGGCIDAVKLPSAATCVRVSRGGEWLTTAHIQGVGIQLWTMQSQFSNGPTRLINEHDIHDMALPNVAGEGGANILDGAFSSDDDSEVDVEVEEYDPPAQLDSTLTTLSGKPRVKFTTLVHLDAIRTRNKAKEAPKAPEKAPFFLGMPTDDQMTDTPAVDSLVPTTGKAESEFTRLLREGDLDAFIEYLANLGPAATDLELRSLDTHAPYDEIVAFVDAVTREIEQHRNFELVQAWMNMLLRVHGDIFARPSEELADSFGRWLAAQKGEVARMQDLTRFCAGVTSYLRGV